MGKGEECHCENGDVLINLKKDIAENKRENENLLQKYQDLIVDRLEIKSKYETLSLRCQKLEHEGVQTREEYQSLTFHYLELKVQLNDFLKQQGSVPWENSTKTNRPTGNTCKENHAPSKGVDPDVRRDETQRDNNIIDKTNINSLCLQDDGISPMEGIDGNNKDGIEMQTGKQRKIQL